MIDPSPWHLPLPAPVGPVRCPSCRAPATSTAHGHLCACGAREHAAEQGPMPRVGVGVLLRRGPRLLMGLRRGPHGGGTWSVPSGHLERGEDPLACAARELAEETGIERVKLRPLRGTGHCATYDGGHPEWPDYVTLWVVGRVDRGVEARVLEPEKCERWAWVRRGEVPSTLFRCFATLLACGVDPWSARL